MRKTQGPYHRVLPGSSGFNLLPSLHFALHDKCWHLHLGPSPRGHYFSHRTYPESSGLLFSHSFQKCIWNSVRCWLSRANPPHLGMITLRYIWGRQELMPVKLWPSEVIVESQKEKCKWEFRYIGQKWLSGDELVHGMLFHLLSISIVSGGSWSVCEVVCVHLAV